MNNNKDNKENLKKEEKTPKGYVNKVIRISLVYFKTGFGPIFNLVMLIITVFTVALAASGTLYVTIPFILIPAFFGVTMYFLKFRTENKYKKSFFKSMVEYFHPKFYGCYQVVSNFFWSLLVAAVFTTVITQIYYYVIVAQDPTFAEKFTSLTTVLYNGNRQATVDMLDNNNNLRRLINFMSMIGAFSFYMFYVHRISQRVMYIHLRSLIPPTNSKFQNRLTKLAIKDINPDYRRSYWKGMWPLLLIEIGSLIGGLAIAMCIPFDFNTKLIFATGFTTLILALFIPYYMAVQVTNIKMFSCQLLKSYLAKYKELASLQVYNQSLTNKEIEKIDDDPEKFENKEQELEDKEAEKIDELKRKLNEKYDHIVKYGHEGSKDKLDSDDEQEADNKDSVHNENENEDEIK